MTTAQSMAQYSLPSETAGVRSPGWWGMVLLIVTEGSLFSCLVAAYFYLRSGAPVWPPNGIRLPDLALPIVMTIEVLISALTAGWCVRSIRRNNQGQLRLFMLITLLLGAIFFALQVWSLATLKYSYNSNAYSSLFYTLQGIHDVHIAFGLLILGFVTLRALLGHFTQQRYLAVEIAVLYWYFVVAMWVVIFLTLFVSPYVL